MKTLQEQINNLQQTLKSDEEEIVAEKKTIEEKKKEIETNAKNFKQQLTTKETQAKDALEKWNREKNQAKLDFDKQVWSLNQNITSLSQIISNTKKIVKLREDEIKAQGEKLNGEIKNEHKLYTDEYEKNKQIPVLQIQIKNLKAQSANEKASLQKEMKNKIDHEHDVEKGMEKNFNSKITDLNKEIAKKKAELNEVQKRLEDSNQKIFAQNKEVEYQKLMIKNYE